MNLKRHDLIAIIFFSVILTLVGAQSVFSFTGTMDVISPGAIEITDINATNYYKNDVLINDRLDGNFSGIGLVGSTIDTGHGANELYDMDQHVLESSSVTFDGITTPWIVLDGVNGSVFGSDGNPFDQDLNTTDDVTFNTVDTGQGANELFDMDQNVLEASAVTFATIDTGHGPNELYEMDQNVSQTSAVTFDTVDTGQGAHELYDMDQDVLQASTVTFANVDTGYVNATEYFLNDVNITDPLAHPEQAYSYLIFKDGLIYKAKNGATGQIDISGTNGTVVFQYAIDNGYLTSFKGIVELDGHLLLNGTGVATPVLQKIIEGEGRNSVLKQTNDNKRCLVAINRACIGLYNFRIDHPETNTEYAMHFSSEGSLNEGSIRFSQMDNIWIKGGSGASPLVMMENIGHGLTVGYMKVQAPNGDAIWINNTSSVTNFGNSAFFHIEAWADPVDGTALTIFSGNQNDISNLMTFEHFDCAASSGTCIKIVNSKWIKFGWVTLEQFSRCAINTTGYTGRKCAQIIVEDGFIGVNNGAEAFNIEETEGSFFKANVYGYPTASTILTKGYNDKTPNTFDLDLSGSYKDWTSSDFTINTGSTAPIMKLISEDQRTPNSGIATNIPDGGAIEHLNGITPTYYWADGTIAGEIVTVTAVNSTHLTIAIKDDAGSPGTTQSVIWYSAWLGKP